MSVSSELALGRQLVEYILCVEGVGWPTNEANLASGFDGTVFVTSDVNGDLASVLGCSIHQGLMLPSGISDSFDPRSYKYKPGDMSFEVQESETAFLEPTFSPNKTRPTVTIRGSTGGAGDSLAYTETTIAVDNANETYVAGDVIWIASREAVLLGTKAAIAGTWYSYSSSTRGYLGTPTGKLNPRPTGLQAFAWEPDTEAYNGNKLWHDRRVALFLHIPGETVGNVARLYNGRMRNFSAGKNGILWSFGTVADSLVGQTKIRESCTNNTLWWAEYVWADRPGAQVGGQPVPGEDYRQAQLPPLNDLHNWLRRVDIRLVSGDDLDRWALAYFYHYRRQPGGTAGVQTAINADATAPQAYGGSGGSEYRIDQTIRIGDGYIKALRKLQGEDFNVLLIEALDVNADPASETRWQRHTPIRYMLDNFSDDANESRYTVNNVPTRNVVDVFLAHLTTFNNEFFIGDTTALGTTTSAIVVGAGWAVDEWVGYAVHIMEGTSAGEARVITSNTATQLNWDRPTTAAIGASREIQIRNSIYDVLPLGWGLSAHNSVVDIDAFELIRDRYLPSAEVGLYAIGDTEGFNLWEVLVENLCVPYGFIPFVSRTTGKLTAVYVGETLPDGTLETYTAITTEDILGLGDIENSSQTPIYQVLLETRNIRYAPIRPVWDRGASVLGRQLLAYENAPIQSTGIDDEPHIVTVRAPDLEKVFNPGDLDSLQFRAMFNSIDDAAHVMTEMVNRLRRNAIAKPTVTIRLAAKFIAGDSALNIGSLVSITDTTKYNPIDPFNGGRGWTNQLARVIATNISFRRDGPALECTLQLLDSINAGKIAPAAVVTAKGSDGGGDYFTIEIDNFVMDTDNDRDDDEFAVGDKIELRNVDGTLVEGGHEIATIDTANNRIYVVGTIVAAITADDYITFEAWSAANSSNMDDFAAMADANETLGAANDEPKEYA